MELGCIWYYVRYTFILWFCMLLRILCWHVCIYSSTPIDLPDVAVKYYMRVVDIVSSLHFLFKYMDHKHPAKCPDLLCRQWAKICIACFLHCFVPIDCFAFSAVYHIYFCDFYARLKLLSKIFWNSCSLNRKNWKLCEQSGGCWGHKFAIGHNSCMGVVVF